MALGVHLMRRAALLACLTALTAVACACQSSPEQTVLGLEAALAAGDADAVAAQCTLASQPLVLALMRSAGPGASPFRLSAAAKPLQIVSIRPQGKRQIAVLRAGGVDREWVLLPEADRWRVDLTETAMRRPWTTP